MLAPAFSAHADGVLRIRKRNMPDSLAFPYERDHHELIELMTFWSSNNEEPAEEETTDVNAQTVRPVLRLVWKLIWMPLLWLCFNWTIAAIAFPQWGSHNSGNDGSSLQYLLLFSLLGTMNAFALVRTFKWLQPQIMYLQNTQNGSEEITDPIDVSPQAHLAKSIDQYLARRTTRSRRAAATPPLATSNGFLINLLVLFVLVSSLVAVVFAAVYGLGTQICESRSQPSNGSNQYQNMIPCINDLPEELRSWDYSNTRYMKQYTVPLIEVEDETLVLGRSDGWHEGRGPLYRVSGDKASLVHDDVFALVKLSDGYCWMGFYDSFDAQVSCNRISSVLSGATRLPEGSCPLPKSVAVDKTDSVWVSCQSTRLSGFGLQIYKISDKIVTSVASPSTGLVLTLPTCLQGRWRLAILLGTGVTCILMGLKLSTQFPSAIGFLFVGFNILIEAISTNAAGFTSWIIIFLLLGLLISGRELPMLPREQQSWALYTLWVYVAFDFALTRELQGFFWLSFVLGTIIAWLVLDHPVLLFLSAMITPWAVSYILVAIIYPPTLLVGIPLAIISSGMVLVDRFWSKLRPYAIYYIRRLQAYATDRFRDVEGRLRALGWRR